MEHFGKHLRQHFPVKWRDSISSGNNCSAKTSWGITWWTGNPIRQVYNQWKNPIKFCLYFAYILILSVFNHDVNCLSSTFFKEEDRINVHTVTVYLSEHPQNYKNISGYMKESSHLNVQYVHMLVEVKIIYRPTCCDILIPNHLLVQNAVNHTSQRRL